MGRQYITTTSFTSPWVDTYPWDNGFKTKYGAPSTNFNSGTPGAVALRPKFTPNGNAIVYVYGTSPRIGAYPFSHNGGYGTAFAGGSPTTGTTGSSLSFISQTEFAATSNSTPYAQTLTFSSTSGFGATRYTPPATAPTGGRYVSASSNVMFFSFLGTPFIGMWPATNPGFGTRFANPSQLPVSAPPALYGQFITHSANDVAICTNNSPHYSAYPWSIGSGFGTRYTLPTNPGNVTYAIEFSKDGQQLAIATAFTPYIFVYPWVTGTGPGTKFANPATLPAGQIRAISFGNSDIFIGHAGSPYLSVYPWSSSGFGTKYADPSTTITADTVVGTSYINVLGYTLNALPYAFNGLTYSQSGNAGYEDATELVMTDGLGTSAFQTVAFTAAGTYDETYVQLDLGKATVINGIVVGADYSNNMNWGAVYTNNKDLSVSTNGTTWTVVGNTGTFTSSIKTVSITPVSARYIKVSKPGGDAYNSYMPVTQLYPTTASSYQFIGIAANLIKGSAPKVLVASAGSFSFSGVDATLTKSTATGYNLTAAAGSFSLIGQPSNLLFGRKLTAAVGPFSLTGIDSNLKSARKITAAVQPFILSGIDSNLKSARIITGAVRSFALTGIGNGLVAGRKITATVQTFGLTGIAASLKSARFIAADTKPFLLSGISNSLLATRKVTATQASFDLTGISAALFSTRKIIVEPQPFTLSGVSSGLILSRKISTAAQPFTLSGQASNLVAGRNSNANVGVFNVIGQATGLFTSRKASAVAQSFSLTGIQAGLISYKKIYSDAGQFLFDGSAANLVKTEANTLFAATGHFSLTGKDASLSYYVFVNCVGGVGTVILQAPFSSGATISSCVTSVATISLLPQTSQPFGDSVAVSQIQTISVTPAISSGSASALGTGALAFVSIVSLASSGSSISGALASIGSLAIIPSAASALGTIGAIGQLPSIVVYSPNSLPSGQALTFAEIGSISIGPLYASSAQDVGVQLVEIRNWCVDKTRTIPLTVELTIVCVSFVQKTCVTSYSMLASRQICSDQIRRIN